MKRMILASASPRRRELLTQVGLKFEVMPSSVDEVMRGETPEAKVMGLAFDKAKDTFERLGTESKEALVIGADTVVVYEAQILGKPKDEADALLMLQMLQGHTHQVYTGVCLMTEEKTETFYGKTDVTMYPTKDETLKRYIASGEPMDKAGSYGIQGLGAMLVKEIHGDYNNVVGLPVAKLLQYLEHEMGDCIKE